MNGGRGKAEQMRGGFNTLAAPTCLEEIFCQQRWGGSEPEDPETFKVKKKPKYRGGGWWPAVGRGKEKKKAGFLLTKTIP